MCIRRLVNSLIVVPALVVGLSLVVVTSASADVTFSSTRTGFNSGVDFSFAGTPLEVSGTDYLQLTDPFAVPGTDASIRGLSAPLFLLGADFFDKTAIGLNINGPYNTADGTTYLSSGFEAEFTFGAAGTDVFGIDVFTLLDPSLPVELEVNVESLGGVTMFEDTVDLGFVGFVATNGMKIGTITFGLVGAAVEGETALGFDNMDLSGVTTIPSPQAAVLGLLGLGFVVLGRRSRV